MMESKMGDLHFGITMVKKVSMEAIIWGKKRWAQYYLVSKWSKTGRDFILPR